MTIISRKGKTLKAGALSVLVVDDQPFYRNLLTDVLRNIGVNSIEVAENGLDAWDALDHFSPDIIIADWIMPEMDGLELTRKIRSLKDEKLRMTPIIMVTSNNLRSQIEEARNTGVDTFILKPISLKAVWDRVKEVIEMPRDFILEAKYTGPCRRSRRPNQNYFGPYRRADDPMELTSGIMAEQRAKTSMTVITKKIPELVQKLRAGDRSQIMAIRKATQEVMALAQEIGDGQLSKVCWSLNTYLEKFGVSHTFRTDVVTAHLEAMEVLIKTPCSENSIRDELVRGLHAVVVKALKAA